MQAKASLEKFGDLIQVSESQYKDEINNAGKGVWVVVCLFQQGIQACSVLLQRLQALSRKFRATKFVKITATDAIRGYPDRNCPTLLIYYEGDLKRQLVGLASLGGLSTTEDGTGQPQPRGRGRGCGIIVWVKRARARRCGRARDRRGVVPQERGRDRERDGGPAAQPHPGQGRARAGQHGLQRRRLNCVPTTAVHSKLQTEAQTRRREGNGRGREGNRRGPCS